MSWLQRASNYLASFWWLVGTLLGLCLGFCLHTFWQLCRTHLRFLLCLLACCTFLWLGRQSSRSRRTNHFFKTLHSIRAPTGSNSGIRGRWFPQVFARHFRTLFRTTILTFFGLDSGTLFGVFLESFSGPIRSSLSEWLLCCLLGRLWAYKMAPWAPYGYLWVVLDSLETPKPS